jgi:AAA15 family ATPase/GTPase
MLLEYGAKNFLSFNEGVEVSFRLNSSCPISISKGKNYTNVLCVKGANGSGKSNILKILDFLYKFCCHSFSDKPNEKINCKSFFGNDKPIEFYVDFIVDNIQYRYEISLNNEHVISEILYIKNEVLTKVIERQNNEIISHSSEFDDNKIIKLRSNASIISTANQYEISSMKNIYNFFLNIDSNFDSPLINKDITSKYYYENKEGFEFAKSIIAKCDLGVSDIKIIKSNDENNLEPYKSVFYHNWNDQENKLNFTEESSGTKTLYNYLIFYKLTLDFGRILVLDEFDINLHPHVLPILINLFLDENINKNNAQVIFTTHNTEIMDTLGKYRTFLVNKENNESFGYRLDEIPGDMLRNDRLISPIYNEGKIGGIPKL